MNKVILQKTDQGYNLIVKHNKQFSFTMPLTEEEFEDIYRFMFLEHFKKEEIKQKNNFYEKRSTTKNT